MGRIFLEMNDAGTCRMFQEMARGIGKRLGITGLAQSDLGVCKNLNLGFANFHGHPGDDRHQVGG